MLKYYLLGYLLGVLLIIMCVGIVDDLGDNKLCLKCENEDVNRDGKVDIKDLLKVQKYIINDKEDGECNVAD